MDEDHNSSFERSIFMCWVLVSLILYWIYMRNDSRDHDGSAAAMATARTRTTRRSQNTTTRESTSLPSTTRTRIPMVMTRVGVERELHLQNMLAFSSIPRYASRVAMRYLPPIKCFRGDDDATECPICMEEFKNGELIQPFGVCVHQFHSSCINAWLLSGKTTCPICRKELSTTHY